MLRFGRAAPILVGLAAAAACGDTSPGDDGSSSGQLPGAKADGGVVVLPDGGTARGKGRSCTGGPGADNKCGGRPNDDQAAGSQDCCEVKAVPGGSYNRFNDPSFPATVSPFSLDVFEVTAGRFRAWVDGANGNLRASAPPAGGGAHPKIAGSGWRTEWNRHLPSSRAEVDRMLGPEEGDGTFMACQFGTNLNEWGSLTWWTEALDERVKELNKDKPEVLAENTKEALDRKPLNCVPWHVLFAFCVWDGGRLPTDAEFGFAAAGGSEQRQFPWGNADAKDTARIANRNDLSLVPTFEYGAAYATARLYDRTLGANIFEQNYSFTYGGKFMARSDNATHIAPVGRKPLGNGKWGHADLAGGMFEWMLDEGPIQQGECNDCANVDWPKGDDKDPQAFMDQPEFRNPGGVDWWQGGARAIRGSAWDNANGFATSQSKAEIEFYTSYPLLRTYRALGGRCARDL
ncbi:MAG: SUMF1/EgtB/PvdO family nonheme iron enzyme [Labilithrix sp.]|nr:SUMF1/EgtB/PvdO family nonheme iron enzyme [Labilithrix sp.]